MRWIWASGVLTGLALMLLSGSTALAEGSVTYCGTVKAYTLPSTQRVGSITLGTRTLVLAEGATINLNGDPQLGSSACIVGTQNARNEFLDFGGAPMVPGMCGVVSSFTPPTSGGRGEIVLGTTAHAYFFVPSGRSLPAERSALEGARACFTVSLDASGDAVVTGLTAEVGGLTGPSTSPKATLTPWAPIAITLAAMLGLVLLVWRSRHNAAFAAAAGLLVLAIASFAFGTINTAALLVGGLLLICALVTGFVGRRRPNGGVLVAVIAVVVLAVLLPVWGGAGIGGPPPVVPTR